jgi:ribosome-binding protein aMBF1 (putative translation factor)
VVLAEADYQALLEKLEDAEDAASARLVAERIAKGEEELVPSAVVQRLVDGENPITIWREYRGLSVSALAAKSGISQSYLSQIEAGKREGRISVLSAIARSLSVDLDDLVPQPAD